MATLVFLGFLICLTTAVSEKVPFNIKPSGQTNYAKAAINDCTCELRFQAMGGTNENWVIDFSYEEASQRYSCAAFRFVR